MAISNLSLVNQKLAYARVLLKMLPVTATANPSERLRHQALLDSTVFQLACGYQHYLRELADNYRVKNLAAIYTETDLLEALGKLEKVPSEATELQLLRRQPDSWLAQLHKHYESLWLPPVSEPEPPSALPHHEELIHVVALDSTGPAVDRGTYAKVAEWERSFTSLVARQRETSCEY